MVDTLLRTSGTSDWIEVVSLLELELNLNPVYWLDRPSMREEIQNSFPGSIFHPSTDASRSIPPDEFPDIGSLPVTLDAAQLDSYSKYEHNMIKMMDRQDQGNITGNHFTYNERKRHYHRLISYWEYVLQTIDIDLAVFAEVPHMIFDYALYATCQENNVKTVMPTRTLIPDKVYFRENIHETPNSLRNHKGKTQISRLSLKSIKSIKGNYNKAKPKYMESSSIADYLNKLTNIKDCENFIQWTKNKVTPNIGRKHMKEGQNLIENSSVGIFSQYVYSIRAQWYKFRLANYYRKLTEKPDLTQPYIYCSLHYQPERSTAPEAGRYVDQYLMINLLAKTVPSEWKIYVKEHPHQFDSRKKGEMSRWAWNYSDMAAIENVSLVPINLNPFQLIDSSKAVATSTGTVGWESLVRGTPVIAFGTPWYKDCEGCFDVRTKGQLLKVLDKLTEGHTVKEITVLRFINKIERFGHDLYITEAEKPDNISDEENASKIANALIEWWK